MKDVGKEYLVLFNGISKTIHELETIVFKLKLLQSCAEEAYLSSDGDGVQAHEDAC